MSQSVTIVCPNCQHSVAVPNTLAPGNWLLCPECKQAFFWQRDEATPSANVTATEPGLETAISSTDANQVTLTLEPQVATATVSPEAVPEPVMFGRFEIRRLLGEGAFGIVHEAFDPQINRVIALKVAKRDAANQDRINRFQSKAPAIAELRHPHIVSVLESGYEGEEFFIALGYVRGQKLAQILSDLNAKEQLMKTGQAAQIVRRLAEGLAYAHAQGILHHEINPDNVMIDEAGEAQLINFGLPTTNTEENGEPDAAATKRSKYEPPEHVTGEWTAASDQYSLGVTLYELLTGETPFDGPGDWESRPEISPPSNRNPKVAIDLETICLKCLERDPANRYPDCKALADDLRRYSKNLPIVARRPSFRARAAKWMRRNPVTTFLCGLVIVVMGALAYPLSTGTLGNWIEKELAEVRFADAMKSGEQAERDQEFNAAMVAYDAALKIRPDDSRALASRERVEKAWQRDSEEKADRYGKETGAAWPKLIVPKKD